MRGCDVAIVGAGVIGLSIAFHLSERGQLDILVLDRGGIGGGASAVQPGGIRQQWGSRVQCLLARESHRFYRELPERLRPPVDPSFRKCGYLFVAHTGETLERLRGEVALQNELGIPSRLLSPDETAVVVPELTEDAVLGASYCAEDGFVDRPRAVPEAIAGAARRNGARLETATVTAVAPAGGGWRLSLAERPAIEADTVVVAAAMFSRTLLQPLGIELPIGSRDGVLFLSDAGLPPLLEPFVVATDRRFAVKQLADGPLLGLDLATVEQTERSLEQQRGTIREGLLELLPGLAAIPLPRVVTGAYDVTPDRTPIVGPVSGFDNLWVAAGFSGYGFMLAPAVGAGIARMVCGEPPGELFDQLSPDRFG